MRFSIVAALLASASALSAHGVLRSAPTRSLAATATARLPCIVPLARQPVALAAVRQPVARQLAPVMAEEAAAAAAEPNETVETLKTGAAAPRLSRERGQDPLPP